MRDVVVLSDEVRAAIDGGAPVVGLETSVLAQGLPAPRNMEAAQAMTAAIRARGAVPAWTGVMGGALRVGLAADGLRALAADPAVRKAARRDLPALLAAGLPGATTVSATLWAAHAAGIEVAATGGIGGVHPRSGDVSADLLELARTPGLLVCSGPKSIVDPAATLERLEELGVAVAGYGVGVLPFFVVADAGLPLEHRFDSPEQAAGALSAARAMGTPSTIVLCNPVPAEAALPAAQVAEAAAACERRAEAEGVAGKAVTPFLLACMAERTGGATLRANLALLESNAGLAAEVAVAAAAGRPAAGSP